MLGAIEAMSSKLRLEKKRSRQIVQGTWEKLVLAPKPSKAVYSWVSPPALRPGFTYKNLRIASTSGF